MAAPLEVRVFECPECHAPLPAAADGAHVTCAFCNHATTIDYAGAALLHERAARGDAEALYAQLGTPPSTSQRIALALTNKWLWIFGWIPMALLYLWIGRVPASAVERIYEAVTHARMNHVIAPGAATFLWFLWPVGLLVGTLIWSLFGARVDARADLQAALASKPPTTAGGAARCRHCGAELAFPAGALGTRCANCGADNLVQIPAAWAARASKIATQLRLGEEVARKQQREGRRRVLRAAIPRVPLVILLSWLVVRTPGAHGGDVRWRDYHAPAASTYRLWIGEGGLAPVHREPALPICTDPRPDPASTPFTTWVPAGESIAGASFALARGDTLRIAWSAPAEATLTAYLRQRSETGTDGASDPSLEDALAIVQAPPRPPVFELTAAVTGWYSVDLRGTPEIHAIPCIVPAPAR